MVSNCLKEERGFGVCLIAKGSEVGNAAEFFPYGTLVEIVDWDREENGLLTIVANGVRRFRTVNSKRNADGLLVGEVELLPPEVHTAIPTQFIGLAELLQRALQNVGSLLEYKDTDFTDAFWVSSRLIELMPMSNADRHELVSIGDPLERLAILQNNIDSQT